MPELAPLCTSPHSLAYQVKMVVGAVISFYDFSVGDQTEGDSDQEVTRGQTEGDSD